MRRGREEDNDKEVGRILEREREEENKKRGKEYDKKE